MKFSSAFIALITFFLCISCAQNYGCVERVTVPDNVKKTATGLVFEPSYWIDLPCDYDLSTLLDVSEVLQNFSYEVIRYNYIPDTGNNTSKLQFELQFSNNNTFDVTGLPIFTMRADGVEFNTSYTSTNGNCSNITSNAICTLTYEKETSLELEKIETLELVSVKYLLAK